MTLFGQSAGGYDIKQILANPPSPLPFRAALIESQNQGASGNGFISYSQTALHFGCFTNVLTCLRKVPATELQEYITTNSLGFFEVVNDGTSVGKQALGSLATGKFADVPILIGTNTNESTVFASVLGINGYANVNQTLANMGLPFGLSQSTLTSLYPTLVNDALALVNRVLTDVLFTCTTSTLASAIQKTGRNVWRYSYAGDFPNLQLFPNAGAFHTAEIPSVWGTYSANGATATQVALSKYMQGVWAGFAKNPTAGAPWPALGSASGNELGILGGPGNPSGEETKALSSIDAPCAIFSPLLIIAGQAY